MTSNVFESSSVNFEAGLKRLLKKNVGTLLKDLKAGDADAVPLQRQLVGIYQTEASASLDKILAAETSEVLNRAATEVASYNKNIDTETMDMVTEIFVNQVSILLRKITDLQPSSNFDCTFCWELLYEPTTLECGHTFCKNCIKNFTDCKVCKTKIVQETVPSANILLLSVVQKLHSMEYLCRSIATEGDELFEKKQYQEALWKYMDAIECDIKNSQAILGRAKAFMALGNTECAVQDALNVLTFRRSSPEMHLAKGQLLLSLKKENEALMSFLACLSLDSTNTKALSSAKQLIEKSLSKYFWDDSNTAKRPKLDAKTSSSCNNIRWGDGDLMETLLSCLLRDINSSLLSAENLDDYLKGHGKEKKAMLSSARTCEKNAVDATDFECSLCMMIFLNPVCTPCGHSFCKECLERTMDHSKECPLCKRKMTLRIKNQKITPPSLDMSVASIVQQLFPDDYQVRLENQEKEVENLRHSTPVFVCTIAFPYMPCPLHIFEPRYRLLLRRALDIHDKQFGIGIPVDDQPFHEYGTIVKIKNVSFTPDGCSVVESVGFRRFKATEYGMKDGYNTAKVQYVSDELVTKEEDKALLGKLSVLIRKEAKVWFSSIQRERQECIIKHFGDFPEEDDMHGPDGPKWAWWLLAILPVEDKIKRSILSKTRLKERLLVIHRILNLLKRNAMK